MDTCIGIKERNTGVQTREKGIYGGSMLHLKLKEMGSYFIIAMGLSV